VLGRKRERHHAALVHARKLAHARAGAQIPLPHRLVPRTREELVPGRAQQQAAHGSTVPAQSELQRARLQAPHPNAVVRSASRERAVVEGEGANHTRALTRRLEHVLADAWARRAPVGERGRTHCKDANDERLGGGSRRRVGRGRGGRGQPRWSAHGHVGEELGATEELRPQVLGREHLAPERRAGGGNVSEVVSAQVREHQAEGVSIERVKHEDVTGG